MEGATRAPSTSRRAGAGAVKAQRVDRDLHLAGCGRRHGTPLGALWSLPNTLLGLAFAALSGAIPRRHGPLLVARSNRGLARLFLTRRGYGAITLGRVVTSTVELTPALLEHEAHHVRQYDLLGPFFIPVYLWHYLRRGYAGHPLEREAEACATACRRGETQALLPPTGLAGMS